MRRAPCDIVVLTEFRHNAAGRALLEKLSAVDLVYYVAPPAQARTNTVCIVSRWPLEGAPLPTPPPEVAHRVVFARCGSTYIAGLYFPHRLAKAALFEYLLSLDGLLALPTLLIGDFNTGRHRIDEEGKTFVAADYFERLGAAGWIDTWRRANPYRREFSWYSRKGNGFRVDHAFVSVPLFPRVRGIAYAHSARKNNISDHSMLAIEIIPEELDVRVSAIGQQFLLEAPIIRWPLPHEPELEWEAVVGLPITANAGELTAEMEKLRGDRRYFALCKHCGNRTPVGHMFGDDSCQCCATTEFGVVY